MSEPVAKQMKEKPVGESESKPQTVQRISKKSAQKPLQYSPESSPRPTPKPSMVGEVVAKLIAAIKIGRLVPGQRLIAEDLAQLFGVSRAPIREALHILAGEGVVELVPNRGAKIRELSQRDLVDIIEFHQTICAVGLRHAAEKMNNEAYRKLVDDAFGVILEAVKIGSAQKFVNSVYEFHICINEISGNDFISTVYKRSTLYYYNIGLSQKLPGEHWETFRDHYQGIYRAVITGNGQTASDLFEAHMDWVIALLQSD